MFWEGRDTTSVSLRISRIIPVLLAITCSVRVSEARQVMLTTVDGVEIRAFEMASGKATMLIYCHRLLSSKESFDRTGLGSRFLREFDVLAFDFRGHKGSKRASSCGGDEVLDLRAAIQYARRTGHQKIALLGVGMGGVVAIREAALFGNTDAVVAVSPCAQPEKLKPWWWNLITDISLTTDYGKIPLRILTNTRISGRYWTGSPLYLADRVSPTPLLLIHGEGDRYLDLEQIQTLYARTGEPKELRILARSAHAEDLLDVSTVDFIITWLKKVLSDRPSPGITAVVHDASSQSPLPIHDIEIHGDMVLPEKMIKHAVEIAADSTLDVHEQLSRIKKEVEALHEARGYILSEVSEMQLSPHGQLLLRIEVGQIDRLTIDGNRQIASEHIQQVLQIAEGHYYNAWEIESAVKRLKRFPALANAESHLTRDAHGNSVRIWVEERPPWSLGVTTQFTDFDQFGGVQFSLNEFRSGAWRGGGQMLFGFQHRDLLYRMYLEKGWFRQEALSIGFGFEQFIYSWDNVDYYFARQEAQERGGNASIAYKVTDNATIHLGGARKRFASLDGNRALPVDDGFINALTLRLENRGRFLRRGERFLDWHSRTFVEMATTRAQGEYSYTVFQFNIYPQLMLSSTQTLNLGLHWGTSWGNVPRQKLFSLGGDTTLPGYDDDTFLGEQVFLLRAKYDVKWGEWLGETSRWAPLGGRLLFDAGDARMKSERLTLDALNLEWGVELNYASLIRFGVVKSFGNDGAASYLYFGWHPHLIRPRL